MAAIFDRTRLAPLLLHVAHIANPGPYALIGLALIVTAIARQRGRVALAIAVILIGSEVTTQLLKPLLAHPRPQEWLGTGQIAAASWPSGHATAAMALALCAILAVPARWRPAAASAGGLFSIAVAYAILSLGWHFPSDVFGGEITPAERVDGKAAQPRPDDDIGERRVHRMLQPRAAQCVLQPRAVGNRLGYGVLQG